MPRAKTLSPEYGPQSQSPNWKRSCRDLQPVAEITTRLEKHYRDVQDFEFTIQDGKLYMLQTRNGKRTGPAAVRIAVEMVEEGLITNKKPLRVEPEQFNQLLHPCWTKRAKTLK